MTARGLPRVIDGLALRAGHVIDILGPVTELRLEADVFRTTGVVRPLLTQAAKAHGIYSRGAALEDFIAGLALGIGEVRGSPSSTFFANNRRSRESGSLRNRRPRRRSRFTALNLAMRFKY